MKKYLLPLIIATLVVGVGIYFVVNGKEKKNDQKSDDNTSEVTNDEESKAPSAGSNSRNIAVMINNHATARKNHAGLQEAKIIYELIVEGGITRYMAIFNESSLTRVGSVRSARHYFLDYALENDAIFIHWGGSPQAYSDITSLKINDLDGIASSNPFFRDTTLGVATEHTGFVDLVKAETYLTNNKKYRMTSNQDDLLSYSNDSISHEDSIKGTDISIKYSKTVTTSYQYDSKTMVYDRFVNGKEHTDGVTKKQYTFKNIIAYSIKNDNITADEKGRQDIYNTGTGTGKYCTEGLCYNIKWSKENRSSQTKYTYEDGTPLVVNEGNTFIQIYPKSGELTIN